MSEEGKRADAGGDSVPALSTRARSEEGVS